MAFFIPRGPLTPARRMALGLAPDTLVVARAELAAWRDAEQAVADASAQAREIIDGAVAAFEAERVRGFQNGKEEALQEQAEQMIENVTRTVDYFDKIEGRMVDLVMQAIRKIIDDYDSHDQVLITVKNMLAVVRNQKQMTLRIHPNQVEPLKTRINDLLAAYPGIGYLDIVGDHRLQPDACILESEIGLVEASMAGQVEALRSSFERVLGSRR